MLHGCEGPARPCLIQNKNALKYILTDTRPTGYVYYKGLMGIETFEASMQL